VGTSALPTTNRAKRSCLTAHEMECGAWIFRPLHTDLLPHICSRFQKGVARQKAHAREPEVQPVKWVPSGAFSMG
jgi:hypothetical protein